MIVSLGRTGLDDVLVCSEDLCWSADDDEEI